MLDTAIQDFLNERKEIWLKKKIKAKSTEEEKLQFEQQASEEFSLATWLPSAAKRAKQLSMVSHPGKFSHPSAKIMAIIANPPTAADGLFRSGNVEVELDVFGNAAALDVFKFLSLRLADNETVLSHLEAKTTVIKEQLTIPTMPFSEVEQGLLAVKQDESSVIKTSDKLKQVYFPVDEDYHLLSIVTPSGLLYKLKERINQMRFSDEAKEVRLAKKVSKPHEKELSEIYGLSVIGYGGTKPQNISVLNSQNGGAAYLLASMPPDLTPRTVRPPRINFFSNSLWRKLFADDFRKLHNLLSSDTNNMHIRRQRDWLLRSIVYQVADRLWMIRSLPPHWSDTDYYQRLPEYQKIWLDQQYVDTRADDLQWFPPIKHDLSRWIRNTYTGLLGKDAIALGDEHLQPVKDIIQSCEDALL